MGIMSFFVKEQPSSTEVSSSKIRVTVTVSLTRERAYAFEYILGVVVEKGGL